MALDIITGQILLPDFIWPATVVIVFLFAVGILHWPTIACRTWMHFRPSAYPVFLSQAKTPILWEPTISHYSSFFFFLIHANIGIIKLRQIHSNDFSFWFMIHHKIKYQVLKQARECFFYRTCMRFWEIGQKEYNNNSCIFLIILATVCYCSR